MSLTVCEVVLVDVVDDRLTFSGNEKGQGHQQRVQVSGKHSLYLLGAVNVVNRG